MTRLVRLVVRRAGPNGWEAVTELDQVRLATDTSVRMATVDKTLFLLLSGPAHRDNRLVAWSGGRWREIDLSGPLTEGRPLAMLTVGRRLMIGLPRPSDDVGSCSVQLAITDARAERFTVEPIRSDQDVPTWPQGRQPQFARLGKRLALLCHEADRTRLAFSDAAGNLTPPSDVDVFDKPPDEGLGQILQLRLMLGLMLGIFVVMFVLRPRAAPRAFVLPEGLHPARFARRVAAALSDLLPFGLAAWGAFGLPWDHEAIKEVFANPPPPDAWVYARLLQIGLYRAYSTLMEWRRGATLGKMLFRIRVIAHEGKPPNLREALLRNLARAIPLLSWQLMPLLVLFPFLNAYRQRLGDLLARTAVVDARWDRPPAPGQDQASDHSEPREAPPGSSNEPADKPPEESA